MNSTKSALGPAYELQAGWEKKPPHIEHRDVADVAVDSEDRVYLLCRFEPRVVVYERDGTFARSWGEDVFTARPHGLTIDSEDNVYVVDEDDQTVKKFKRDGTLVSTIGVSGVASDTGADWTLPTWEQRLATIRRGGPPFNHPTNVVVAANGEIFVSDGYGNARVHRFSASGELIQSWGKPGSGPGEFRAPHHVAIDKDGRVLVSDRENDRIQVFTPDGEFIEEWTDIQRPDAVAIDKDGFVIVAELSWKTGQTSHRYGYAGAVIPSRATILDPSGQVCRRFGLPGTSGALAAPHGVAIDSQGDMYISDVVFSFAQGAHDKVAYDPSSAPTIQKFIRK